MRACGHCASAALRDKMVASGQTLMAVTARIYMLERAAGARAAKQARGLPAGRPAKLNATTCAGAAQRIGTARSPNRSPPTSASAAPAQRWD
jgi:hypothetical protein